jgi:hypothetical protein
MMKIGAKNVAGLDVNRANNAVKMVDRIRRSHRGSLHFSEALMTPAVWLNSKDNGKLESKPTLEMPFLLMEP